MPFHHHDVSRRLRTHLLPAWLLALVCQLMMGQTVAWTATVDSVTPYGVGSGDAVSPNYSVSVNGVAVPVYNNADMSYAHFAFTGTANVVVTVGQNISSYQLSPHSFALAPSVSGNTVSFALNRPRKVMLHAVNSLNEKLCIFAEAPEEHPPVSGAANVTTLSGLDASGATDVTTQLQAAVDNTPTGNTLLIPAGRYTFTYLQFRSNKSYYLAPGAILQAPRTQEAQLKLNGCTNVKIFGRGVFDDQGDYQRARTGGGETGTTFISVDQGTGTSNVVFEDVIIRNPSLYSCIVFDTVDWRFGNVKFVTSSSYGNRDCIDPHNAQRLVVDDGFFLSTDDNIAYSTLRNDIDTGIVVKNCVMYNSHSGACIRLGPWLGDNTHHFTAENCDYIKGANNEGAFAIYAGGALSDVRFRNMRVENPQARLIYMISAWNDYYAGWQSGSIDNVRFENLSCETVTDSWIGFDATDAASPMCNFAFTNLNYGGTTVTNQSQAHVFVNGTVSNLSFSTTAVNEVAITAAALSASASQSTFFAVSRSGPTGASLTIPLVIRGSAVAGSDYTALGNSVVIPAGASSVQVAIAPLKSSYPGGRATVVVDLNQSPAYSYLLGPNHCAMTTLVDGVSGTAPAITSQPANITVTAGQMATFTVAASGTGPLSYQWKFASANVGSNSATLTLANAQAANAGSYTCVVTNSSGSVTSNAATLTVNTVPVPGGSGTGLTGTYFPSADLSGAGLVRTDATVNFDWGQNSPATGIPVDNFSVRWTGQVQAQVSETYTFSTVSDDGVRLWINGQQLINNWTVHGPIEDSGSISLIAGQTYEIKMEFYDSTWGAMATLAWASPSTAKQIIPMSQLYPAAAQNLAPTVTLSAPGSGTVGAAVAMSATAADSDGSIAKVEFFIGATLLATDTGSPYAASWTPSAAGSYAVTAKATDNVGAATVSAVQTVVISAGSAGSGLTGTYFSDATLTNAVVTRIDATVDFDWGTGAPASGVGADGFSVRWTGQVQAQLSETYTFTTLSDDGVRLWVNGQQLVNNWTDHGPTENSGTITLVAGQTYDLKMEYFENGGGAVAKLSWASPSTAKQIIPQAQLIPGGGTNALPAGWTAQDVGSVAAGGSTTQSNGTWMVIGSGADIWNAADGCRFAWRRVTGDVQVTARVASLTNTDSWAKAGVMIRESLTAGSPHASTFATSANGIAFQRRAAAGGATSHTAGPGNSAPYWVRIERVGNVVISSASADGATWTEIRRETIAMSAAIYVGLAVTSHNDGQLCTGTFTNVQVVGVAAAAN